MKRKEDFLAEIDTALRGFSLKRNCDVIRGNTLRIATPFLYPDGSCIDLFLEQDVPLDRPDQDLVKGYILSDLGETVAHLYSLRIKLASRKRRKMVSDICKTLKVEFERGEFQVRLEPGELNHLLPDAMIRLAQACIRVADLVFSQRFPTPGV